jgi:hypothetical protein
MGFSVDDYNGTRSSWMHIPKWLSSSMHNEEVNQLEFRHIGHLTVESRDCRRKNTVLMSRLKWFCILDGNTPFRADRWDHSRLLCKSNFEFVTEDLWLLWGS